MTFAAKTKVVVATSRYGIEKMLRSAGASRIVLMEETTECLVAFHMVGRLIKMTVAVADDASDQQRRSLWRGIDLIVKAKLESVAQGVATIEQEFLAYVVLPDGDTVGDWFTPQLQAAYDQGTTPKLLPDYSGGRP